LQRRETFPCPPPLRRVNDFFPLTHFSLPVGEFFSLTAPRQKVFFHFSFALFRNPFFLPLLFPSPKGLCLSLKSAKELKTLYASPFPFSSLRIKKLPPAVFFPILTYLVVSYPDVKGRLPFPPSRVGQDSSPSSLHKENHPSLLFLFVLHLTRILLFSEGVDVPSRPFLEKCFTFLRKRLPLSVRPFSPYPEGAVSLENLSDKG